MFTKLNTFYKLGSCCNMRYHYFTLSMLRARWCSANIRIPSLDVKVRLRKAFIVSYCKQANKIKQNSFHRKKKKELRERAHRQKNLAEINDFISQFAGVAQSQDNFFQDNTSPCSFLSTPFHFPPFGCQMHFNNVTLLPVISYFEIIIFAKYESTSSYNAHETRSLCFPAKKPPNKVINLTLVSINNIK